MSTIINTWGTSPFTNRLRLPHDSQPCTSYSSASGLWVAFSKCGLFERAPDSTLGNRSSRYPYCNVFMTSGCFGVSQGDQMTLTIPSDYQLYEVVLPDGLSATIYSGGHADMDAFESATACHVRSRDDVCRRRVMPSGAAYLYYSEREDSAVVVTVRGITKINSAVASDFVRGFRPCRRRGLSIECQPVTMFDIP
jgi:hypothetical protein